MSADTVTALESLAAELAAAGEAERAALIRTTRALARIAAARSPDAFSPRALVQCSEPGHWDGSYPPSTIYLHRQGPVTIIVRDIDTVDVPTSTGYYHSFRRETDVVGLAIAPDGTWYAGTVAGTGRVGQYAAHPGDCDVDCTIAWSEADVNDVPIAVLASAVSLLRDIAFPPVIVGPAGALP